MGQCKYLTQMIQIELFRDENPNWPKATPLAIYKPGRGTRDYREQIQLAFRVVLELEASELQVQRSNRLTMLPDDDEIHFITLLETRQSGHEFVVYTY